MEREKPTQHNIAIDQVQRLTDQTSLGISATALLSIILAMVLFGTVPRNRVLLWLGSVLGVCLYRMILQFYFHKHPLTVDNINPRRIILIISLAVSGGLWGSVPIFLFPESSLSHQVVITFVLGGMLAGSVGVFASIIEGFFAFSIPTMVPLVTVFFKAGDNLHMAMGTMLIFYCVFMFTAALRLNREIYDFWIWFYDRPNRRVGTAHHFRK